MRDYRVLEGLFFNDQDRSILRERLKKSSAGSGFVKELERQLKIEDATDYPRLRFDWYGYNPDMDHALSTEDMQNFNGIVAPACEGKAYRTYLRTLAYELLGKEEYRDRIRKDMLRFPEEIPLHIFVMSDTGLNFYRFLKYFIFVLDAERDWFTEEEQWRLDSFARGVMMDILYNHEEWLRSRVGQQPGNNHLIAHSLSAVAMGLYYHRQDWVKYGLEDKEGIYNYLENCMTDPGMGIEGSLKYNLLTAALLMKTAEVMKRAGHPVDLYRKENSRGYSLKSFFEAAMDCVTVDGRIIPIGDNYAQINILQDMPVFFRACVAYGHECPGLIWLAQKSTTESVCLFRLLLEEDGAAAKPDSHSRSYENYGMVVLKTPEGQDYWQENSLMLAVRTGYAVTHGNCDHMALLLFKGEKFVIRDFEGKDNTSMHVFSAYIQRTLNRSRLAHSAVMIDGMDTPIVRTALKTQLEQGESWQRLIVEDRDELLYKGVWQKRTLELRENLLTDVYEVVCDRERDIDYIVHIGDPEYRPAFAENRELLAEWFPHVWPSETLAWMRDVQELDGSEGLDVELPEVRFLLKAEGAKKALSFDLPEADDFSMGATHSYLLRLHGKTARFEAEYRFV